MSIQGSVNQALSSIGSTASIGRYFKIAMANAKFQKEQAQFIDREIKATRERDEALAVQRGMEYGPDRATMERLKAGRNPGEEVVEFEPGTFDRSQYNVIDPKDANTNIVATANAAKKAIQSINRNDITERILMGTPSEYLLEPKGGK